MMNKYYSLLLLLFLSLGITSCAQKVVNVGNFNGAAATLKEYKALYVLNQSDDKKIRGTIRNINNALEDPRLKGKLKIELVAFGDGVELYKKSNHYVRCSLAFNQKEYCLFSVRTLYGNARSAKKNYGHSFHMHPVVMGRSSFVNRKAGRWCIHDWVS
jgi:uncharacterized protein